MTAPVWTGSARIQVTAFPVAELAVCEHCPARGVYGVYWQPDGTSPGFVQVCDEHIKAAVEHALDDSPEGTVIKVGVDVLAVAEQQVDVLMVPTQIARAA